MNIVHKILWTAFMTLTGTWIFLVRNKEKPISITSHTPPTSLVGPEIIPETWSEFLYRYYLYNQTDYYTFSEKNTNDDNNQWVDTFSETNNTIDDNTIDDYWKDDDIWLDDNQRMDTYNYDNYDNIDTIDTIKPNDPLFFNFILENINAVLNMLKGYDEIKYFLQTKLIYDEDNKWNLRSENKWREEKMKIHNFNDEYMKQHFFDYVSVYNHFRVSVIDKDIFYNHIEMINAHFIHSLTNIYFFYETFFDIFFEKIKNEYLDLDFQYFYELYNSPYVKDEYDFDLILILDFFKNLNIEIKNFDSITYYTTVKETVWYDYMRFYDDFIQEILNQNYEFDDDRNLNKSPASSP